LHDFLSVYLPKNLEKRSEFIERIKPGSILNRFNDSIELLIKIVIQENSYHRVVVDHNRGVPIRYCTLEPYTILEPQYFVNSAYTEW